MRNDLPNVLGEEPLVNAGMRSVVILRSNPVSPDPRVEKAATSLSRAGWTVRIVAWDRSGSLPVSEENASVIIVRIPLRAAYGQGLRNLRSILHWQLAVLRWLVRQRQTYSYIHACDFDTVLPAMFMKLFFRKKLVYDVFDYAPDTYTNVPEFVRSLIRRVDRFVMNRADAVILADDTRRRQVGAVSPRKLEVIYNSPRSVPRLGVSSPASAARKFRVAYVGILSTGRGLYEMLDILARRPEWHLEIAGFGSEEGDIRQRSRQLANVTFHGRVDYTTALEIYQRSSVMFATYDPAIPNHRFSSPNKLYEAMSLGKPIIVARNTGVDELVARHGLGAVVTYGDLKELESALEEISAWPESHRASFAKRVQDLFHTKYSWEIMEKRLVSLYRTISGDEALS